MAQNNSNKPRLKGYSVVSEPLAYALEGNPHLIITQVDGDNFTEMTDGFEMSAIFETILHIVEKYPQYKDFVTNCIIELTKNL